MEIFSQPHRRHNPLTGEWILVSPQRVERPWLGQVDRKPPKALPRYDPGCYLCPGNGRAGGKRNPDYSGVFVFDNDYPALLPDTPDNDFDRQGLLRAASERGVCRVVCFSPRHDLTISELPLPEIRRVVDCWCEQTHQLGAADFIRHVQIFENRGPAMGASNPHPHCQVWGDATLPDEPAKELRNLEAYRNRHGGCLLCDYLAIEEEAAERIVMSNRHFAAVVPFWAAWPFETLVVSRRHIGSLTDLEGLERDSLAELIKRLTTCYDRMFAVSFPYSMGFHQSPSDGRPHPETHLHAHYYPPLLRSATVRKFMVGYEMLANPQRDLTAETAAALLRKAASPTDRQHEHGRDIPGGGDR